MDEGALTPLAVTAYSETLYLTPAAKPETLSDEQTALYFTNITSVIHQMTRRGRCFT